MQTAYPKSNYLFKDVAYLDFLGLPQKHSEKRLQKSILENMKDFIAEFEPAFMGQLEFYLEALDNEVKRSNENPSIGILLCKETNREIVKYALNRSLSPTMIAKYERELIPKEMLQRSLSEFFNFVEKE